MFGFLAKLLLRTSSGPTTEAHTTPPSSPPPPPSPPCQQLPFDVLLEIAARTDPTTAVCCAATCRPLRCGILDPSFRRRRLAILAAANSNGVHDLFDPALLVGFSYQLTVMHDCCGGLIGAACSAHVVKSDPSPRPRLRVHPRLLEAFEPVASRDGLVVLRLDHGNKTSCRNGGAAGGNKFHVWDALTARATSLPAIYVSAEHYPVALLNVGATDRSFDLLVADQRPEMMRFKTFSSKTGRWSADRAVHLPPPRVAYGSVAPSTRPAVVGRTVHWLCRVSRTHLCALALDSDAGAATTLALPPGCSGTTVSSSLYVYEVLLACVGGRLSCLVSESSTLTVSVWTLTSASPKPSWSRQVVVGTQEIERSAGMRLPTTTIRLLLLLGFGERSGVVILQVTDGSLVRLNLATKEATALGKYESELASHVCVYEIVDMESALQAMKPF